jgi:hypothetical protein
MSSEGTSSSLMYNSAQMPSSSSSSDRIGIFRNWWKNRTIILLTIATFLLNAVPSAAEALRCYCTDDDCVPYGVCTISPPGVCLVGLVSSTNAVIRTCGEEPLGCQRGVGKWADLCSCDQPFCNTFSFLRQNTQRRDRSRGGGGGGGGGGADDSEDSSLVFQRVDPPLGDFSHYDNQHPNADAPFSTQSSLLTLLLVVIPLSVGATAIVIVAFNYYCHLC